MLFSQGLPVTVSLSFSNRFRVSGSEVAHAYQLVAEYGKTGN